MIKDCKINKVLTAKVDDSVLEVAKILRDTLSRHLVVIDENEKPVGFLSVVDINNRVVAEELDPKTLKAKDIMTNNIVTVEETEKVSNAVELMIEKDILSCPVTNDGKLIGICEFKETAAYMQNKKLKEVVEDGS